MPVYNVNNQTIAGDLTRSENISLEKVVVQGKTSSTYGKIVAIKSTLQAVDGSQDIDLDGTNATKVCSKYGKVTMKASMADDISASQDIHLQDVKAKQVKSQYGKVTISGGEADDIQASQDIGLTNLQIKTAKSSFGKIHMIGGTAEKAEANGDLKLEKTVVGKAISNYGTLTATDATIEEAKGTKGANLKGATIDTLKTGASAISLDHSKIDHLEVSTAKESSIKIQLNHDSTVKTIQVAYNALKEPYITSATCPFRIMLGEDVDVRKPLPDTYADIPRTLKLDRILVNNHPFVFNEAEGRYEPVIEEGEEEVQPVPVNLEIQGGKVTGDIEFQECVGQVKLLAGAILSGKVINGTVV